MKRLTPSARRTKDRAVPKNGGEGVGRARAGRTAPDSGELRTALILRDLQGLSYIEIAESLELPEGTVKSRIHRGRLELARIFSKEGAARGRLHPKPADSDGSGESR